MAENFSDALKDMESQAQGQTASWLNKSQSNPENDSKFAEHERREDKKAAKKEKKTHVTLRVEKQTSKMQC